MRTARIMGFGMDVPPRVVDNEEIGSRLGVTADWVFQRTGIETRHFVEEGVGPADLAAAATRRALERAGLKAEDLDLIIFATFTPDHQAPGSSWFLHERLGLPTSVATFDVRAQCAGFLAGLNIARQFIATGTYEHILVVGAEVQSTLLDWSDEGRSMAILFGDGAGVAVLGPSEDPASGVIDTVMHSDGANSKLLWMPAPASKRSPCLTQEMVDRKEHLLHMDGHGVFDIAIRRFPEVIREMLDRHSLSTDDISLIVPHQANLRILRVVQRLLELDEGKVFVNIGRYGNTSAATIPIALTEIQDQGLVEPGDLVLLAAFGGGLAWASTLLRW